MSALFLHFSNG